MIISLAISLAYLALAFALFHRAMPSAAAISPAHMWKMWFFGVAIGSFALARMGGISGFAMQPVYTIGHLALISYCLLLLRTRFPARNWWDDQR